MEINPAAYVILDTETHPIAPYAKAPRLVCMQLSEPGRAPELVARGDVTRRFREVLGTGRPIVGHNLAAFDLPVLMARTPSLALEIFEGLDRGALLDTFILEKLLRRADGTMRSERASARGTFARSLRGARHKPHRQHSSPKRSYSLEALAQQYLGIAVAGKHGADSWRLRFAELEAVPVASWPRAARDYALADVDLPRRVLAAQLERAAELEVTMPGVLGTWAHECRSSFALALMSAWGICVDGEAYDALLVNYEQKFLGLRRALADAGLIRTVGRRNPEWKINQKRARARAKALGASSLQAWELRRTQDAALCALADYQSIKVKALGVYLPLLADGIEQPIHCSVDPVLVSGRSSTFAPNMQNLPRVGGFRECFVPRAGRVFCGADFDGAELRSLAQTTYLLCGDRSRLAALFRSDPHADPHLAFAAESLLGITLDEAVARKRKKDPEVADARQRAKAANFGFPGMMGANRFAANSEKDFWGSGGKGTVFSKQEALDLRARYLRQWPEQQVYFARVAARCASGAGTFRVPVVGGWRGGCGASDGANNAFQGLTAYGAKRALYEVCRACYVTAASPLYGGRPVLFVHDEAIVEVSEESAHDAATELEKIMVTSFQSVHPDIPVGASAVLMRRWYKGAEPVFDTEGRRTFWEPEKEKK